MDYKFQTQFSNLILITPNLKHVKYSVFSIIHRNWVNLSLYYLALGSFMMPKRQQITDAATCLPPQNI